jgi:hypothetical protein
MNVRERYAGKCRWVVCDAVANVAIAPNLQREHFDGGNGL